MVDFDLDLMPWAPRSFRVRGATGRIYRIEEWLPFQVLMRISQLSAEQLALLKELDATDLYEAPEKLKRLKDIYAVIQKLAFVVLQFSYEGLTLEEVEADFPNQMSIQFLDFLFIKFWFERFKDSSLQSSPIKATEETPKPKRSSRRTSQKDLRTGS